VLEKKLDRERIRDLYSRDGPVMLAYAVSLLHDRAASEDVLHQVFTRLLEGNLRINGSLTPYVYRAIRNAAFNYRRDRSRETNLEANGRWLQAPPGMEDTGLALEAALQELRPEQREVIVLHIWGQMTFDETAAALDISPNTAASRYRYGLARLKERLGRIQYEHDERRR
jgi:RNA polymerase sigma-70 factor (ECF subfamily)